MVTLQKIDEVAIRWNKTKDPKDKKLWYKLIKEWNGLNNSNRRHVSLNSSDETNDGRHNTKRRTLSTDSSDESNAERYDDNRQGKLF